MNWTWKFGVNPLLKKMAGKFGKKGERARAKGQRFSSFSL
jgi:hypothetical protein